MVDVAQMKNITKNEDPKRQNEPKRSKFVIFKSKPMRLQGGQDRISAHVQTKPRAELEKIVEEGSMDEIIQTLENSHLEQAGGYREAAIVGLPEDLQSDLADRLYRKRKVHRALIKAVSYTVPVALISTLVLAGVNSGAIGLAIVFSVIFRYVAPRLMRDIGIKNGQIAGLLESDNKLAEDAKGTLAKLAKEEMPGQGLFSMLLDFYVKELVSALVRLSENITRTNTRSNVAVRSTTTPRFLRFSWPKGPSEVSVTAPDEADREQQVEAECLETDEHGTGRV
jgi:hypothetical protein